MIKNKFGYCKFQERCHYRHVTLVCEDDKCDVFKCEKRDPKICSYYRDFRRCKFTVGCKFKHENQYEIFKKFERKLEELKANRMGMINDDRAQKAEEKLDSLENMIDNQRKEIEEKNAKITGLEMRMEEIEKNLQKKRRRKIEKLKK